MCHPKFNVFTSMGVINHYFQKHMASWTAVESRLYFSVSRKGKIRRRFLAFMQWRERSREDLPAGTWVVNHVNDQKNKLVIERKGLKPEDLAKTSEQLQSDLVSGNAKNASVGKCHFLCQVLSVLYLFWEEEFLWRGKRPPQTRLKHFVPKGQATTLP